MGEGKARPTALNGAVNRPHLRRKCLRQNQTPICLARNGSPARQGKLVANFGDGLRLTATARDVGRTKLLERYLDWGERAKGPLSPCSVDWNLSPAHQSAGSFPYSGRYFFQTVGRNETRQVGAFHAEPPEADIETSSKSNISLRCRMSAWSPRCTLNSLGVCTRSVRNAAQARHLVLPRSGKSSHFCRPQRGKNLEFAGRGTKGKFAAVFKGRYFESAFRPFVVDLEKVGKASIMKSTSYGYL